MHLNPDTCVYVGNTTPQARQTTTNRTYPTCICVGKSISTSNHHQYTPSTCVVLEIPHHQHVNHHQRIPSTCVCVEKSTSPARQTTTNTPNQPSFVLENLHHQHVKPPPMHLLRGHFWGNSLQHSKKRRKAKGVNMASGTRWEYVKGTDTPRPL